MKHRLMVAAALAASCAFSAQAFAAADPVQERQAIFKEYKKTFGAMGDMVKGKTAYDQAAFAKLAVKMEQLSKQPWQHFPAGSDKGKSEAQPAVWTKTAEFKKEIDTFEGRAAELAKAAAAAKTVADVKPAFGAAGQSCKSCHDGFKKS